MTRTYKVNGEVSEEAYIILSRIMYGFFEDGDLSRELQRMAREFCATVIDEPDSVARDNDGLNGREG